MANKKSNWKSFQQTETRNISKNSIITVNKINYANCDTLYAGNHFNYRERGFLQYKNWERVHDFITTME